MADTPRVTVPVEPTEAIKRVRAYVSHAEELEQGAILVSTSDLKALISAAPAPEGGAVRYRHKKRGTEYTLIGVGRAQGELQDDDPVVLYRGDDGGLWVRHQVEFCDGRFEQVSALATREEAPAEAGEIGAEYDAAAHCVTLAECTPGLFLWNGTLGFKSEYGAMEPLGSNPTRNEWKVGNRADAYCADSGEYFWGGTSNHDDRAKLLVYPISAEAVAMVASHGPSALRAQPPAREDAQPVAWAMPGVLVSMKAEGLSGDIMPVADDEFTQPLYTHPASDALRVAVEALKTSRENIIGWFEAIDAEVRVEHEMHVSLKDDLNVIDQALVALQAEQEAK
ncbi:hypothetical protein ACIGFJ_12715 [Brevundimonas diminuta]|uniref:hypothetical protein n=1 Tax=Brevundimonas diminuta TaxID=293 RepID=UPI0037C53C18